MTLIERVRAVIEAGTPGPWESIPGDFGWTLARSAPLETLQDRVGEFGEYDARLAALAVNLAPLFVALWAADMALVDAEKSADAERNHATLYLLNACIRQHAKALAALNDAAAREVGE